MCRSASQAERRKEVVVNASHRVEQIIIKNVILMVKEGAKWIAGTEELLESGARIAMELICKVTVGAI